MIAAFILLYGLGSGALAVARATIPLVFYDNVEFTRATSRIAMPLNIISAASPPILVGLLVNFGSNALLGLAMLCSCERACHPALAQAPPSGTPDLTK